MYDKVIKLDPMLVESYNNKGYEIIIIYLIRIITSSFVKILGSYRTVWISY